MASRIQKHKTQTWALWVGIPALLAVAFLISAPSWLPCMDVPHHESVAGSHGFRIWSGESLKSFKHGGRKICIPAGWQPLGEIKAGNGWALFPNGTTGLSIKTDAFASTTLPVFDDSSYRATVLYPITTPPKSLAHSIAIITNAFNKAGALFSDTKNNPPIPHTVLITAGVAGRGDDELHTVYPDPTANLTFFIYSPEFTRAEQLVIHAVVHVYNRERPELDGYERFQSPFSEVDWQEIEAAWSEIALATSAEHSKGRLLYLYNVHRAVQTKNFSLITELPFDNREEFNRMHPNMFAGNDASYLDEQYGHYVLPPLVLSATDALLLQYKTGTSVEKLLLELHTGEIKNFFNAVSAILPGPETVRIESWIKGEALIPADLVF